MKFGFSTGSLAKGDFRLALQMLSGHNLDAVELSALREEELPPLLDALSDLDLRGYEHISLHAPSKLQNLSEQELVNLLVGVQFPIVVHPDVITSPSLWCALGDRLLIENMDKRKPVGRTADELDAVFDSLPEARLCLDVGHARQIDSSLYEMRTILRRHGHRLAEVHLSEVNSACGHERLSRMAIEAFQQIAYLIPGETPIILETPVESEKIGLELERAGEIFKVRQLVAG